MHKEAEIRLHNRAVDLWRASLTRTLSAREEIIFHAIEGALNPLLPDGFAAKYLGRGTYYATNAEWDEALAGFKARDKRR